MAINNFAGNSSAAAQKIYAQAMAQNIKTNNGLLAQLAQVTGLSSAYLGKGSQGVQLDTLEKNKDVVLAETIASSLDAIVAALKANPNENITAQLQALRLVLALHGIVATDSLDVLLHKPKVLDLLESRRQATQDARDAAKRMDELNVLKMNYELDKARRENDERERLRLKLVGSSLRDRLTQPFRGLIDPLRNT